jgi:hypothetical protein
MREFIESLCSVEACDLIERAKAVRRRGATAEWEMAAILMAAERREAFLECDCKSVVHFAERTLGIEPRKARELLAAARIAENYPLLSAAFRDGSVCWTKLREIARVVDASTEAKWVAFAKRNNVRRVERAVARPPRVLRKATTETEQPQLFDLATASSAGPLERVLLMPSPQAPGDQPDHQKEAGSNSQPREASQYRPHGPEGHPIPEEQQQIEEEAPQSDLISLRVVLKPEEYAVVEAAMRMARGQLRGRRTKGAQLAHIAKQFLAKGSSCGKARYRVVVQVDGTNGVYLTDRGELPVEPARMQELLSKARPDKPRKTSDEQSPTTQSAPPRSTVESHVGLATAPSNHESAAGTAHVGHAKAPSYQKFPKGLSLERQPNSVSGQEPSTSMPHVGQPERASDQEFPTGTPHVGQSDSLCIEPRGPGATVLECADKGAFATCVHEEDVASLPPTRIKRQMSRRPTAIREILARSGWACVDCGSRIDLELDHIVPLCKGGGDDIEDHQPLCRPCHARRHRRDFASDPAFQQGLSSALQRRQYRSAPSG